MPSDSTKPYSKLLDWGPKYARLLRTRAYLSSLPLGLDSYPECRGKGSIWRNIHQWTDTSGIVDQLPLELPILPTATVLGASWIPLVQHFAGHLVLRDCLFATDDEICEHFRSLNHRLLSGPLYRVMFAVASPQMAASAAGRRFATMFEGITLHVSRVEKKCVHLELRYPRALMPALIGRLYLIAFEVAIELAGGKEVRGRVINHSDTTANYDLSWK
jgi:hypothetical protein